MIRSHLRVIPAEVENDPASNDPQISTELYVPRGGPPARPFGQAKPRLEEAETSPEPATESVSPEPVVKNSAWEFDGLEPNVRAPEPVYRARDVGYGVLDPTESIPAPAYHEPVYRAPEPEQPAAPPAFRAFERPVRTPDPEPPTPEAAFHVPERPAHVVEPEPVAATPTFRTPERPTRMTEPEPVAATPTFRTPERHARVTEPEPVAAAPTFRTPERHARAFEPEPQPVQTFRTPERPTRAFEREEPSAAPTFRTPERRPRALDHTEPPPPPPVIERPARPPEPPRPAERPAWRMDGPLAATTFRTPERAARGYQPSAPEPVTEPNTSAPQSRERSMSRIDELNLVLRRLQSNSPGIEGSALISEDGLLLASALTAGMDESRIAGMTATLLNLGSRAARELGRGDLQEVIVRGDRGYTVVLNAGYGTLLLAITNESSKLGLIFFDMRETIQALQKIL